MDKKTVVILTSHNSTSLGIARGLGRAGCRVEIFYVTSHKDGCDVVRASKYVSSCYEYIGKDSDAVRKLNEIYAGRTEPIVLLPTCDHTMQILDNDRDKLNKNFVLPFIKNAGPGRIVSLMDKSVQERLAADFGLPVPRSCIINLAGYDEKKLETISYPCFCKPLKSSEGGKYGMKKCDNKSELKKALIEIKKAAGDIAVFVQEYLDITQEYAISGICINDCVIMPAALRKLEVAEYPHGVTMLGEILSSDILKDFLPGIERMMKSLRYTGLFDIDIFECGGNKYFGEINFRSSGVGYALINTGANLPLILASALLGEDWKSIPVSVEIGKKYCYDEVAWRNHIKGYSSLQELESLQSKADFSFVCGDKDDPAPERFFLRKMHRNKFKSFFARTFLGRIIRRIIKGR